MRNVTVAVVQMQCAKEVEANIAKADAMVREAAAKGPRSSCCRNCSSGPISVRNGNMNTTPTPPPRHRIRQCSTSGQWQRSWA